ncbi:MULTISPECIES: hypothetical protein [unclassified Duganella]|uniref:hypothetical protein n=1 Tax=unclassified Duganella TaxID=2636909 RepID=UPI000E34FA05|nr:MULTISPECIES: hypothetical protein [unclassified Duganella]RFP11413.1 hypothetical protein D0T23_21095 [Duganella sp. BJB475]RFP29733.1 hypothetical protein D0T21_17850 [Duganella sp. BJB476]
MKMPLVFDENGDVSLYWSLDEARRNIEEIDVRNNEYVAYDAAGRMLTLSVMNDQSIEIKLAEDMPSHAHDLVAALRRYVNSRQARVDLDSLLLVELLQLIDTGKIKN